MRDEIPQNIELDHARLRALMLRLADGDRTAASPTFALLWPPLHRFALRFLGNASDADDAAQEAIQKIFASVDTYDASRSPMAWAIGITAWECRTLRRRRQRRREAGSGLGLESDPAQQGAFGAPFVDGGESPEEELSRLQLGEAARSALGTLSSMDQETILAAYGGGADARPAIAGATFRKRRERALSRLREAWRLLYGAG